LDSATKQDKTTQGNDTRSSDLVPMRGSIEQCHKTGDY